MIESPHYGGAVIVTGDGDFFCLVEYLEQQGKLKNLIIPNRYKYSLLLRPFSKKTIIMNSLKRKLEYKKREALS